MSYGLPYKGSKSRIASWVVDTLPSANTLVDIFFGGGAITHCALLSGKYRHFVANDIRNTPALFVDCMKGKYIDENRWISRDEFLKLRASDPFVSIVWSFGNNMRSYIYSREIEPYKEACHYAIVNDDWERLSRLCPEIYDCAHNAIHEIKSIHDRRVMFGRAVKKKCRELSGNDYTNLPDNTLYKSIYKKPFLKKLEHMQNLQAADRLKYIQKLNQLENEERTDRVNSLRDGVSGKFIDAYAVDYRELEIPDNSVVYCDPPYKETYETYKNKWETHDKFDTEEFLDWCVETSKKHPVYISEFNIKDPRFELVASRDKIVTSKPGTVFHKTEKLYRVKD